MLPFAITNRDPESAARAGELTTPHGVVRTPAFMPVGTAGTVKGVAAWELDRLAPEIILANTYHLLLRPGIERLERLGGLHRLMGWPGPILTDSGGYQVHSLATRRRVDDDGVTFQSHLDGSSHRIDPESSVDAQVRFGVDIAMVLDECLPFDAEPRWWSAPQGGRWHGRCAGCAGPGHAARGGLGRRSVRDPAGRRRPGGPWPLQRGARRAPFRRLCRRGPGGGRAPTASCTTRWRPSPRCCRPTALAT